MVARLPFPHRGPTFPAVVGRFSGCWVLSLCLLISGANGSGTVAAADADMALMAGLQPFLQTHCAACHDSETKESGLDLSRPPGDWNTADVLETWIRVHDRVAAGEMPPSNVAPPRAAERTAFTRDLGRVLTSAHAARKGTVLRRLNRQEYENTLNDLFGTNLDLASQFPQDGRSREFDNVGEALGISLVHMQQYLNCAEQVLDAAIVKTIAQPESKIVRAGYADTREAERFLGDVWLKRPDGAVVFFKAFGYPSGMLREANVRTTGWYKVRVRGYAYQTDRPVTFSIGATTFARGAEKPTFSYHAMPPGEPTTVEIRARIPANYMIEVTPQGLFDRDNEIRKNGIDNYAGAGLAIQWIEVEGPIVEEFPGPGHRLIFDGLRRDEILPRNLDQRTKSWYVPKFELKISGSADIVPALRRVATRLFRRPVTEAEVAPYLDLFRTEREGDSTAEEALRTAVTAMLCSPDFLFLRESPGRLNDDALASRLSYFLTRTAPDDELLQAAAAGDLSSNPQRLIEQAKRLLQHEHHERFVTDFTDAWLNLRDIDFTNPDGNLYPEFDRFLQHSMVDETRAFFRELLRRNLSVANVVKSDFAMLNNRLAEHYNIPGVAGPKIRPVNLPDRSERGGFLSQGSVLKVSANGTNTSPVVRGVWVTERILGIVPPPPPPGIAGVEPDIRGAETLRELLDKHRNLDSCRHCHELIDPPGFALECFNPVGGLRERFRTLGDGERVRREVQGRNVRYELALPVDASGVLQDGRQFANFQEFRDHLASDKPRLAKAVAAKLLTFATGRELGFSDRKELDRIVQASAATGYGMRDLLLLAIDSEIFRHK